MKKTRCVLAPLQSFPNFLGEFEVETVFQMEAALV